MRLLNLRKQHTKQYIFIHYLLKCTRFKIWELDLEFYLSLRRAVVLHTFPIRFVCVAEARLTRDEELEKSSTVDSCRGSLEVGSFKRETHGVPGYWKEMDTLVCWAAGKWDAKNSYLKLISRYYEILGTAFY